MEQKTNECNKKKVRKCQKKKQIDAIKIYINVTKREMQKKNKSDNFDFIP